MKNIKFGQAFKVIFTLIGILFLGETLNAQKDNINIRLELVSISTSNMFKLPCHEQGDFYPVSIDFEFIVENNTGQEILFGTNTADFYRGEKNPDIRNDGIIGKFLMINKSDSLVLYTRYFNLVPDDDKEDMFWASVDVVESFDIYAIFENFLCQFPSDESSAIKLIYDYINNSTFVYVPIVEDYENAIEQKSKARWKYKGPSLIYPKEIIRVKPMDLLIITIGERDNYDEYEIYYEENGEAFRKKIVEEWK